MASAVFPVAVGPTMAKSSPSQDRAISSAFSTTDTSLELVKANAGDDRAPVRAVSGEVYLVEGQQEGRGLLARKHVTGSNAAVAGHRREDEVCRFAEWSPRFTSELRHEIANDAFGACPGQEHRHRVDGDRI